MTPQSHGEDRDASTLITVIADIREKTGVGVKPMLSELADAIAAREGALREALDQCAAWFQEYADSHTKQGKPDKAKRNQDRADYARSALASSAGEPVQKLHKLQARVKLSARTANDVMETIRTTGDLKPDTEEALKQVLAAYTEQFTKEK